MIRSFDLPIIGKREYVWPDGDERLYKWVSQVEHVSDAIDRTTSKCVCIQAGGACGIWPLYLSHIFGVVYTFEPFLENFNSLVQNCLDRTNIVALRAAVGDGHNRVRVEWHNGHEGNFGAQFVRTGGVIPTIKIDDLSLDRCDLICLDIEGTEDEAISGARETIAKFSPVILIEDAGHWRKLGKRRSPLDILNDLGYRERSRMRDDAVMTR